MSTEKLADILEAGGPHAGTLVRVSTPAGTLAGGQLDGEDPRGATLPAAGLPDPVEADAADGTDKSGGSARPGSIATQIAELAAGAKLFHTPAHEAFAAIDVEGHIECIRISSARFGRWLRNQWFRKAAAAPATQALTEAVNLLEARACCDGPETEVFTRIAGHEGRVYLDLGNRAWEVIEITAHGWRVISNSPVRFRRPRGMASLPAPHRGGRVDVLRPFVNVGSDEDWILLVSWIVACLRPAGPYPVLGLNGEQGSAKSTTARVLRALLDPNIAPLRAEPREERDLMISATNAWLQAFDNVSHLHPWLSDAVCRLATGGGFATRELYADADETIFDAQRPVLLNGIGEVVTRSDLLDRTLMLTLPSIAEDRRRPEADFWRDFEQVRPAILGALLDILSICLRVHPGIRLRKAPRMADFAAWSTAASVGSGWGPKAFADAYATNRQAAHEVALEGSQVGAIVTELARKEGQWEGTATELFNRLGCDAAVGDKLSNRMPRTPRALANELKRLAPNLRATGVDVNYRRGHGGRRMIMLGAVGDACVTCVTPVTQADVDAYGAEMGSEGERAEASPSGSVRHPEEVSVTGAGPEDDCPDRPVTGVTQVTRFAVSDSPVAMPTSDEAGVLLPRLGPLKDFLDGIPQGVES